MDRPIMTVSEYGLGDRAKPIQYVESDAGCWECVSHANRKGYALVWRGGSKISAHRHVYELKHGKIRDDMVLLHGCDNPSCINPDHLKEGTQKENMLDKMAKGRGFIPRRGYCGQTISNEL